MTGSGGEAGGRLEPALHESGRKVSPIRPSAAPRRTQHSVKAVLGLWVTGEKRKKKKQKKEGVFRLFRTLFQRKKRCAKKQRLFELHG